MHNWDEFGEPGVLKPCTVTFPSNGVSGIGLGHDFTKLLFLFLLLYWLVARLILKWYGFESWPVNQKRLFAGAGLPVNVLSLAWFSVIFLFILLYCSVYCILPYCVLYCIVSNLFVLYMLISSVLYCTGHCIILYFNELYCILL